MKKYILKNTNLMTVVLVILFIIGMPTTQVYANIDPDTIVGLWLFNDGHGDIAKDSSGNRNDGKLMNGPMWVNGRINPNKALDFDGKDDYVLVHFGTALQSLSLEAWIYPTEGGVVFSELGQATINAGWHDSQMEILSSGEIKVGFWTGAIQGISLGRYSFNEWYNVVMTYDRSKNSIKGYINGELMESGTLVKQNPGDLWYAIGAADTTNHGNGTFFSGIIDRAAVYNVALTEDQVKQNYRAASAVFSTRKLTTTWGSVKFHD